MGQCKRQFMPEQKIILRELAFGPCYIDDLVFILGIHKHNVARHLKDMRSRDEVRIVGYDHNANGHSSKLWGLGPGKDAVWHARTPAERAKLVRLRAKQAKKEAT